MAAMLPSQLRLLLAKDALVVADAGDTLRLLHRRHGRERPLADGQMPAFGPLLLRHMARRQRAVPILRVAADLLQRDVALPLAAERDPAQVLRYEMDRLTPFGAEDVVWDWAVLRRDAAGARLHLRLWLLPRAAFSPLLASLAAARFVPAVLEAAAPDGSLHGLPLRATTPRRLAVPILAGSLCAALALTAVMLPFVRQSLALAAIDARIETLRAPAAAAATLRRQAMSGGDVLAAEQARVGDAVLALAAVTDALPDGTYLTDLSLRQRRLVLGGQSRDAAGLIARLAADRRIRDPGFMAPVTHSDLGKTDRFEINAVLAP